MSRTWLVLDGNYLAHRAFHVFGKLSYQEVPTGVVFGFLRDILTLQELHGTKDIVFCFDYGKLKARQEVYPDYKQNRQDARDKMSEEEKLAYKALGRQITLIRDKYLHALGFRNIFFQRGYEADDVIASICAHAVPKTDTCLVVSADHDLYQLLSNRVILWNPHRKEAFTRKAFIAQYGIEPSQWPDVKAIAGCSSDNVPGIRGVGEKTAAKFVAGKLDKKSKAFQSIISNNKTWRRNLELVALPYPGTELFTLRGDKVTPSKWAALSDSLGMSSITETMVPDQMRRPKRGIRHGKKGKRQAKGFDL